MDAITVIVGVVSALVGLVLSPIPTGLDASVNPTFINVLGVLSALAVLVLSPIPTKLGLYRWMAKKNPIFIGLTPGSHYGIPWNYTFEKFNDDCKSIAGQTALVIGANSGVGFEIALALARCGARVTLACRDAEKCKETADKINESTSAANISTMIVDASSLASVETFCKEFLTKHEGGSLDMLFLNAGRGVVLKDPMVLSEDGIEFFFANNYLGQHLVYKHLEPLLRNSAAARIVLTSSVSSFSVFPHKIATSLEELNREKWLKKRGKLYGQSKLAQIAWAKKVTRELGPNSNVFVNAFHPGAVDTALWDKAQLPFLLNVLFNRLRKQSMWSAKDAALTGLFLGVRADKENIRGRYYHPQAQEVIHPVVVDEKLQDDLWEFSEQLVADFVGVGKSKKEDPDEEPAILSE